MGSLEVNIKWYSKYSVYSINRKLRKLINEKNEMTIDTEMLAIFVTMSITFMSNIKHGKQPRLEAYNVL